MTNSKNVRHMPIGVQDFASMIEGNHVYVDKTQFIPMLDIVGHTYFLSRPRRFGKSLFLSTLQAYYERRCELFEGLYIEKYKAETGEEWKEYPVLKLDLNAKEYTQRADLVTCINKHIEAWEEQYKISVDKTYPESAFASIIRAVNRRSGKRVVILIDEYDNPLFSTIGNEKLQEEYRSLLRAFYSVIKSLNGFIHISFLTGITKFAKVSIFSGLNNLQDISYNEKYSSICGITEKELLANFAPEVQRMAEKEETSYEEMLNILRKKYDGYRFSPIDTKERIFNPFSIFNMFKQGILRDYWFESATPSFLVKIFEQNSFELANLEDNISISSMTMDDYRVNNANNLIPLLFQTGYLTIKDYDRKFNTYVLGFPNDEVRYAFLNRLMNTYKGATFGLSKEFCIAEFADSMERGDIERVLKLTQGLLASIPYDSFPQDKLFLREHNFQTAIYLIFRLMGQYVRSEVHSSAGRSDVEVETSEGIYIFEFKVGGRPLEAIAQIKEAGYADKYVSSQKRVFLIGAVISRDKRTLTKWKVESYEEQ